MGSRKLFILNALQFKYLILNELMPGLAMVPSPLCCFFVAPPLLIRTPDHELPLTYIIRCVSSVFRLSGGRRSGEGRPESLPNVLWLEVSPGLPSRTYLFADALFCTVALFALLHGWHLNPPNLTQRSQGRGSLT
jgi:hypothetical protein